MPPEALAHGGHQPPTLTLYTDFSSNDPTMKVYAVIAGAHYEGESFNSLRLFDCKSAADAYAQELEGQIAVDYVLVETREVCLESALATASRVNTADGIHTPW